VARRVSPFRHGRSEAFERRGHAALLRRERQALARNIRQLREVKGWTQVEAAEAAGLHPVHVSRIELGTANPALPTLVALANAFGARVHALFEERDAKVEEPFRSSTSKDAVPLLDLAAAAGAFGAGRAVEPIDRVVPRSGVIARPGMFVARVVGHSMEPLIPDGAYCLFSLAGGRLVSGRVVLVQLRDDADPETGGAYTVKRLRVDARGRPRLVPENSDFDEIVPDSRRDVRVVAELVAVLGRTRA